MQSSHARGGAWSRYLKTDARAFVDIEKHVDMVFMGAHVFGEREECFEQACKQFALEFSVIWQDPFNTSPFFLHMAIYSSETITCFFQTHQKHVI